MELSESRTLYTATYSKVVDSIQDAFVFVMSHLDKVGNDPQVIITPTWECEGVDAITGEHDDVRRFDVSVTGGVELPEMVQ